MRAMTNATTTRLHIWKMLMMEMKMCANSEFKSSLALMRLRRDLDIDVDEICTVFVTKYKRRMFQGCILYE